MDHGILNVPLNKRSGQSIDQQLDQYTHEQEKSQKHERKVNAQKRRELISQAKAHVNSLSDTRIEELSLKFGITPKSMRKWLVREAFWQPRLILGLK